MNLLASLFGAVVRTRNGLYDHGTLRSRHLDGVVISVGNLSVGGSGKTPFVILLGELLKQRGIAFDVLSRGYRRQSTAVELVDPHGDPRRFGDEPILIARKLGVPVIVGAERYDAGRFAESRFGPQLHLLDDGFQHRQLARDFDIVLLTQEDARDALLPEGRLREPLSSLSRADAVVLMGGASPEGLPRTALIWRARRGIILPPIIDRCIVFCGIARPHAFFDQLCAAGARVAETRRFSDHHVYTERDIAELLRLKQRSGATGFITTEKDAVNLGAYHARLRPLQVVPVSMELENADAAVDAMLARIAERKQSLT